MARLYSWFSPYIFSASVLTAAAMGFVGLAWSASADVPVDSGDGDQCVADARWIIPGKSQSLSTANLIPTLANKSVVLLGEFHDSVGHHQWQLATLSALNGYRNDIAIGLEMLPRSAQPVLDRWIAGELSEAEFLKKSKWYEYWKFDASLYSSILNFARINRIPVYGLNVEKDLVKRVRTDGWESISEGERLGISDPAPASEDYLEMLASSFSMHGTGAGQGGHDAGNVAKAAFQKNKQFRRFVQGQQLWDRGMAQSIAEVVKKKKGKMLVGIMGSGHMMNGFGVPHQLKDLGINDTAVLLPWDRQFDCKMLTPDLADAVFGLSEPQVDEEQKPKLGVHIENAENGVKVVRVVTDSIAQSAGIREDDIIVTVAGRVASNVIHVIDAVQRMVPGTWLPIVLDRDGKQLEVIAKFPSEHIGS